MEVLFESPSPGVSEGKLGRRQAVVELNSVALRQQLANEFAVADALSV